MAYLGKIALLCGLELSAFPLLQAQSVVGDLVSSASESYYNNLIDGMFSYLTPMQRAEFEKALYPALDKNPELVSDGLELLKEGGAKVDSANPQGTEEYLKKLRDYEARLRQAMTTEDPDVGKIFDQIDAHMPAPS